MSKLIYLVLLAVPLSLLSAARADEDTVAAIEPAYAAIELSAVLDAVANDTGKTFVVDAGVDGRIFAGQLRVRSIDMATLHSLLFANGLAAVDKGEFVRVMEVARIRQQQLPFVGETDREFADDEWVTHLIRVEEVPAALLVPILRPLLPPQAHLVANKASNTLLLVDRYASVQRLSSLIRALDKKVDSQ
ncbi:MAG: secretin N-terminal domain-containing protein [Pseudomonadota bacterium]